MSMVVFVVFASAIALCNHMCWIEAPNGKQYFEWDIASCGFDNPDPVHMVANPLMNYFDVLRTDEIGFVQHNQVRKANLTQLEHVQSLIVAVRKNRLRVNDAGNTVKSKELLVSLIQEGHHDAFGVGHTARFQDDVVDRVLSCEQLLQRVNEVVADFAADATICETDCILLHAIDEFGVDIDGAKIVNEHAHPQAMLPVKNPVQQRGLSGAEEAGQ
jgi:hypothetical protein